VLTLAVIAVGLLMLRKGTKKGGSGGVVRAASRLVFGGLRFLLRQSVTAPANVFGWVAWLAVLVGAVALLTLANQVWAKETHPVVAVLLAGIWVWVVVWVFKKFHRKPKRSRPLPERRR
jgi:hypothetical protein